MDLNRKMEDIVDALGGVGWIYSLQFRKNAEEFWKQYEQERYVELRIKSHATKMFDIWDKVTPREDINKQAWWQWLGSRLWRIWPLDGLYGVASATLGGDFLLAKSAPLLGGTSSEGHVTERDRDDLKKFA